MQPDPDDDRDQTSSMQKACMLSVESERSVSLGLILIFILPSLNSFLHQSKMQTKRCTVFKTFFSQEILYVVFKYARVRAHFPLNILIEYYVCNMRFCQSVSAEIIYLIHATN